MSDGVRLVHFRGVDCEVTDGGARVRLAGEIDIAVADELRNWLLEHCEGREVLSLDLARIGFIDSTGLHLLIRLKQHLEETGRRFQLAAVSEPVRGLLGVSGLSKFFD